MHMFNLGLGRVLNGSLLADLAESGFLGNSGSLKTCLEVAVADFRRWSREKNVNRAHRQARFTAKRLGLSKRSKQCPTLASKAYNGRVVSAWLSSLCLAACEEDRSAYAANRALAAWSFNELYTMIEQLPRHVPAPERQKAPLIFANKRRESKRKERTSFCSCCSRVEKNSQVHDIGMEFLRAYHYLNRCALQRGKNWYRVLPKCHMIRHMLDRLLLDGGLLGLFRCLGRAGSRRDPHCGKVRYVHGARFPRLRI